MKIHNFTLNTLFISSLLLYGCREILGDREQPESIVQAPPVASYVFVFSPTQGTIYNPGDTISVKWIAPTIKRIDIQLYRKSEYKFTITENIENTGRFNWIVPIEIPLSNHYQLKVINHINSDTYQFSGRFGIQ